jgi:outer membrane protein assembly factor BamB
MKRKWWKWFLLAAGLVLAIEGGMLLVEGPTGQELPWRYRIAEWWDRLFGGPRIVGAFAVAAQAQVEVAEFALDPEPGDPAWPMFGGTVRRNMVNLTARGVPTEWSVEDGKIQNVKWSAELGTKAYGGPVIADGKVFFGTNNANPRDPKVKGPNKAVLMCFDAAGGKFLWQAVHEIPADALFNLGRAYGLCSTPCVEGKRHYYLTPGCEVVCGENDTGKVVWRYDLMAKQKVVPTHLGASSPLVVDDLVMVVTGNGIDEGGAVASPKAPSFIALRKDTGEPAWQSNLPGENIIEGQWSNPAVAVVGGKKQVIFPGGDCWLYSFEPTTGKLIWKCNCNPLRRDDFTPYIVATPVVHEGRCYVGLGCCPDSVVEGKVKYSYFLCLDVTGSGDVSPKNFDAKDPANKGSALVWAYGGPIEPPPKKGRRNRFGKTLSTCAVHDGLVYIAEDRGYLHCLDAKTGQHYWEDDLKTGIWGSPYYVDGKVYLGNEDGDVVIYRHGKELKVLNKVEMGEGIHSTPAVAGGVLYLSTWSKLYAIAPEKK